MKRNLGSKLGLLLTAVVMAYAMTACVVVDDDYICEDGEILIEAGDVSCDGYDDCGDYSDEYGCGGLDDYYCDDGELLIAAGDVSCDDYADCGDYSDELACFGCYSDEVSCAIGGFDDCGVFCDGYVDCDDGFDEPSGC